VVTISELIVYMKEQMPDHQSFRPVDHSAKVAYKLRYSIADTALSEAALCDFVSQRVSAYDADIEECRDLGEHLAKLIDLHIFGPEPWWRRAIL
jgi:hypothetical protein